VSFTLSFSFCVCFVIIFNSCKYKEALFVFVICSSFPYIELLHLQNGSLTPLELLLSVNAHLILDSTKLYISYNCVLFSFSGEI
jgi:hypothetical protein